MTRVVVGYGGQRLDRFARVHLQDEQNGSVEALLKANPELADQVVDGWIPAGTAVLLPTDFAAPAAPKLVLPWM